MIHPAELPELSPEQLRKEFTWPPRWRLLAVTLWSGFLGATLGLLAMLMGWDALQAAGDETGFGALGVIFLIGWAISAITALVAVSLAKEPQARLGAED